MGREDAEGTSASTSSFHRLLSPPCLAAQGAAPDLRDDAETNERGRVLLDPALLEEMVRRTADAMKRSSDAGKLGSYLLPASPPAFDRARRLERGGPCHRRSARSRGCGVPAASAGHRQSLRGVLDWLSAHDAVSSASTPPPGDHVPIFPRSTPSPATRSRTCGCHGRHGGLPARRTVPSASTTTIRGRSSRDRRGAPARLDARRAGPRHVTTTPASWRLRRPDAARHSRQDRARTLTPRQPRAAARSSRKIPEKDRRGDPGDEAPRRVGNGWTPNTGPLAGDRMQANLRAGVTPASVPSRSSSPYKSPVRVPDIEGYYVRCRVRQILA